jgi:DNA-binding MarR family transcriptional regulator
VSRPSRAARAECEADVLDSLCTRGPLTLTQLVEDTGRTRGSVEGAVARLVRRDEALLVSGPVRRWRAA